MKFCPKCGQPLRDDDLFCPKCGAKQPNLDAPIEEAKPAPQPAPQPVEQAPVQPAPQPEPVKEEPKPAPTPVEEPKQEAFPFPETKKEEPAPAPQEQPKQQSFPFPEQKVEQPAPQEVKQEEPAKKPRADDFRLRDSVIMFVGFAVLYIVYLILVSTILVGEKSFLGKLGFFFSTMFFTAMGIIRLVKSCNRKLQFAIVFHIMYLVFMLFFLIGDIIILANT